MAGATNRGDGLPIVAKLRGAAAWYVKDRDDYLPPICTEAERIIEALYEALASVEVLLNLPEPVGGKVGAALSLARREVAK